VKGKATHFRDGLLTLFIVSSMFVLSYFLDEWFLLADRLTPMLFVLGVFVVSLKTQGYFFGVTASLLSVLAVNYAFTFPYYAIDLLTPENFFSALLMLAVSIATSTLTIKISRQEKMKAEAVQEYMRANLLRAISHDLRTPLTTIYGSCSAMMENYDSLRREQHLKLLGEVRSDAQWLIRMVENLLSVTRLDDEGVLIEKTPTVLEELTDTVLVKFRKRCPEQIVQVEIPEEFIMIPMDAMLIEQVLINLLENAVHHARGMTKLLFQVRTEGGYAIFTVSDDGCGIAPERLPRLFTGYLDARSDLSDARRSNMGIGLSVCSTIIRAHGSEIFAANRPEGGAEFTFRLKMEDVNEQQ